MINLYGLPRRNTGLINQTPTKSFGVVEQIIRPTGLIDPELEIKPTRGQVKDVAEEIKEIIARAE